MNTKANKTWSLIFVGVVVLSTCLSLVANYLSIREYYKNNKSA
ncbi:hypothetical protein [Spirosoma arboris]|nr:hypothetical protein [Spirosoma arboris]